MSDAKWDLRYLKLAGEIATWSKDPSTKVGAVIIGRDRRNICHGYNGFPRGIADTEDRLNNRDEKYSLTQHAERNALDNAQFDLEGSTLAVTMFPCSECAKSIISKRIHRVISPPPVDREPWSTSSKLTMQMFDEVGVQLTIINIVNT